MKKSILTSLLFSFTITVLAQHHSNAVKTNGALRVEKGKIVNKDGKPAQLRGISFSWSIWNGRKYYNPAVVDWLVSDFKVSLIRVAMAVQPEHGYLQEPEVQKDLVISVIDRAIKDGIYVLVDWHDHHGNLHEQESKKFFGDMAKRYKGVPNIIYEIWNEPERTSQDTVKQYAGEIIPVIRRFDQDNLIVVGSPHWDQDVDTTATNPIVGFKNIAYSFHFYASDDSHQENLRARADKALKAGLPLFVTEWGVGEANGGGKFDIERNKIWLKWLEDNRLCWANWNITDKTETTAILLPGASEYAGWSDDQLTPAGIYIHKVLNDLNHQ